MGAGRGRRFHILGAAGGTAEGAAESGTAGTGPAAQAMDSSGAVEARSSPA